MAGSRASEIHVGRTTPEQYPKAACSGSSPAASARTRRLKKFKPNLHCRFDVSSRYRRKSEHVLGIGLISGFFLICRWQIWHRGFVDHVFGRACYLSFRQVSVFAFANVQIDQDGKQSLNCDLPGGIRSDRGGIVGHHEISNRWQRDA
jgi:hypothetical protein